MALVTGSLLDFQLLEQAELSPRIIFIPSGPGVRETGFLFTRPITAMPIPGGTFSVNLAATANISPDRWYNIRVEWLDPVAGYIGADFPEWKLRVPIEGGTFGDLVSRPLGPSDVWESVGPVDPPGSQRGDYVYDPSTGLLTQIV